jgi:putative transposase
MLPEAAMLHLICRGNNGMRVFRNRNDFAQFSHTLRRYTLESSLFIHHYVMMHTHVHILAWCENTDGIAQLIKAMTLSYHYYFARKYRYRGHLWHSRYRSIVIEDEAHWIQCGRYIELNPVYARMRRLPDDYPWSSYHYYAYGIGDSLMRPIMHPSGIPLHIPGKANTGYQEFVHAGIDLDYQQLKKRYEAGKVQEIEQTGAKKSKSPFIRT